MLGIMVGVLKRVLKDAKKGIKLQTFAHTLLIIVGEFFLNVSNIYIFKDIHYGNHIPNTLQVDSILCYTVR
jgi:hypothetical protein